MTEQPSQPTRYVSEQEMRARVERIYARNPEENLLAEFSRSLLDPAKPHEISPEGEKGRARPHPLLVALGGVALFMISVFIYFSFLR